MYNATIRHSVAVSHSLAAITFLIVDDTLTVQDQLKIVKEGFRHVIILGAGASRASCIDNPEKNQRSLPLMNDLIKVVNLDPELDGLPKRVLKHNFEDIFSKLHTDQDNARLVKIETKVFQYFAKLQLPETPTIYDYLVLSLREKDLIATFNWDPFLWQAYERNLTLTSNLPKLAFLHGNVAIGICEDTKEFGPVGTINSKTDQIFQPTKLLYPIEHKDYALDPYIKDQWNILSHFLKKPARTTIFGYSAPKTDIEAIALMKKAWGDPEVEKQFTQFEIIDIQEEELLYESWKDFIFSHHYQITKTFFESTIMKSPRRTGEIFEANYLDARFAEINIPPKFNTMSDMWKWYEGLLKFE